MRYRLGLDVGTASCGLVALALGEAEELQAPLHSSVHIFPEPLQPAKSGGVGEPKKAARRMARLMRKQVLRKARRLRRVAQLAPLLGLEGGTASTNTSQTIHALRSQAAITAIALPDLLQVLLKLAKRRGYAGSFKSSKQATATEDTPRKGKKAEATSDKASISKQAEEAGVVEPGIKKLKVEMAQLAAEGKLSPQPTVGQYLHYRSQLNLTLKLKEDALYAHREMLVEEFRRIWQVQSAARPELAMHEATVFKAVFFQRLLKSPAPMVGRCPLEPTLPRAPAAQMAAQDFRIEKQLADLRWGMGRNALPLSPVQKTLIRTLLHDAEELNTQGELTFKRIREALETQGLSGPPGKGLNMERASRESLRGNSTALAMRKLGVATQWVALSALTQMQVINFLADLGSPDALEADDWHQNFRKPSKNNKPGEQREFAAPLVAFINQLRTHPSFGRLKEMGLETGRMGYSIKALNNLAILMQEGWDEHYATKQAYPEHSAEKPLHATLPLPQATGNVVVDVALRQVHKAVQAAIKKLGAMPVEVVVELSRDMALGVAQRSEIEGKINLNRIARKKAAAAITTHGLTATDKRVHRYQLWEGQQHYCPYCGERMSLGDALGGEHTHFEHILPRSLTRVGGKRSQLVLAHRTCNDAKGNRTPWEAFGAFPEKWAVIEEAAKRLEKNRERGKAKLLLMKDWQDEVLDDASINDFTDRQFHESSWIAKATRQWLQSICPPGKIWVSRGELTAHLRRIWKLDTVIPQVRLQSGLPVLDLEGTAIDHATFEQHRSWWEGQVKHEGAKPTDRKPDKRIDHRHHLVDALVIAQTSRSLYQRMAQSYKTEKAKASQGQRAKMRLHAEPPLHALRDLALQLVADCIPQHRPDRRASGALFEGFAYSVSRAPDAKSGKYLLVRRILLGDFAGKDAKADVVRKALGNIEAEHTRNAVLAAFDARTAQGKTPMQALAEPVWFNGTHIKRVRVLKDSVDTAATIHHTSRNGTQHRKLYAHAGNAYLEITVENGKLKGEPSPVNMQKAAARVSQAKGEGVRRFWKGDMVALEDGSIHIVGQIRAQAGGMLCLVPVTETCGFGDLKKRGLTLRTVSSSSLVKVKHYRV